MDRINTKETIHEINMIRDLLISSMDHITELLRKMNDGNLRMLTRTSKK